MTLNRQKVAGAGLFVSLALLISVPSGWALTRPAMDVGSLGALTAISPSPSATPSTAPPTSPPQATAQPVVPTTTPAPSLLAAPTLGLQAAIDPVGVDSTGAVAIPVDARRLGWYRFGSAPGDAIGSAVLVGHRDSRTQGKGALYPLGELTVGDPLVVTRADRTTVIYRVIERRLYLKSTLPVEVFFGRSGSPRLTVITCGGPYDPANGGYQDNLVVTAVPSVGAR